MKGLGPSFVLRSFHGEKIKGRIEIIKSLASPSLGPSKDNED